MRRAESRRRALHINQDKLPPIEKPGEKTASLRREKPLFSNNCEQQVRGGKLSSRRARGRSNHLGICRLEGQERRGTKPQRPPDLQSRGDHFVERPGRKGQSNILQPRQGLPASAKPLHWTSVLHPHFPGRGRKPSEDQSALCRGFPEGRVGSRH